MRLPPLLGRFILLTPLFDNTATARLLVGFCAGAGSRFTTRFTLATMAGILPASFVLAHFGSAAMDGTFGSAEWIALGLGLMTGFPLLLVALQRGAAASKHRPETDTRKANRT